MSEKYNTVDNTETDSDTSQGSSPYQSENEATPVVCFSCKSRRCLHDKDTVDDGWSSQFLSQKEVEEICLIAKEGELISGTKVFPKNLKFLSKEAKQHLGDRVGVIATCGLVFCAPSFMMLIKGRDTGSMLENVLYDVCCISPTEPLKIITFITDTINSDTIIGDNTHLTRLIMNHIKDDMKESLGVVYGVIENTISSSLEEYGNRVKELEIVAKKKCLPRSLQMDVNKYRNLIFSLLKFFSPLSSEHVETLMQRLQTEENETVKTPESSMIQGTRSDNTVSMNQTDEQKHFHSQILGELQRVYKYFTSRGDERQQPLLDKDVIESQEYERKVSRWGPNEKQSWRAEDMSELREKVCKERYNRDGVEINLRIVMYGPTGHGKSSLCNGFKSAINNKKGPSTYHAVGGSKEITTKVIQGFPFGKHWIYDTPGTTETNPVRSEIIEHILSGKISQCVDMDDQAMDNIPPRGIGDVSCVVMVLKYNTEVGPELKRQVDLILKSGGKGKVSFHLVLTYLDECDDDFCQTENIPHLYDSISVQTAVRKMSTATGIPPYAISFVRNYVWETKTDLYTSLLHLRVLERIMFSSLEEDEQKLNQQRIGQMLKNKWYMKPGVPLAVAFLSVIFGLCLLYYTL